MPTTCSSRLEHCLPARPDSIGPLRRALVAYAESNGASERQREDIALAVSEALSNVVVHAYAGSDGPGDMRLEAWVHDDALHVAVSDDGIGMAPRLDSPGLGLGLAIIARICDHLQLQSRDGASGMSARMAFMLG